MTDARYDRGIDEGDEVEVDVDVAIIGGGITGLVAALRLRRPEVVGALPASAMILEGQRPGGMLNWGGRSAFHIAGPGYRFRDDDWERLVTDAKGLEIPIVDEAVIGVDLAGPIKALRTPSRVIRSHAVILASGAFPMRNAAGLRPRDGLITAFGPIGAVRETIQRVMKNTGRRALALFGTEKIAELAAYLEDLTPVVLVEPPLTGAPPAGAAIGTLTAIVGEPTITAIEYRDREGALRRLACDCVYADFNAYMNRTSATAFLDGAGITGDDGFVIVDREQATALPGVYAAGDVTGGIFAVSKSIYEGTRAGFSALRYVHQARRGFEPNLYPFFFGPYGVQLGLFHRPADRHLELAGSPERGLSLVVERDGVEIDRAPIHPAHEGFWRALCGAEGPIHAGSLAAAVGVSPAVAHALLFELVRIGGLAVGLPPASGRPDR